MVRLTTAATPMEARILAARLGSEGIVWEFRGSVDGPLALGPIDILVDADGFEVARGLLLADEIESSFGDVPSEERLDRKPARFPELWLAAIVIVLVLFAVARMLAHS